MKTIHAAGRTFACPFTDLLPPLTDEERAGLKADIQSRGIMIPIVLDEEKNILDGQHRAELAAELGLKNIPTQEKAGLSWEEKRAMAWALNTHRRQLTRERLEKWILSQREKGRSIRQISETTGASVGTVHKVIQEAVSGEDPGVHPRTPDTERPIQGKDGKSYPARRPPTSAGAQEVARRNGSFPAPLARPPVSREAPPLADTLPHDAPPVQARKEESKVDDLPKDRAFCRWCDEDFPRKELLSVEGRNCCRACVSQTASATTATEGPLPVSLPTPASRVPASIERVLEEATEEEADPEDFVDEDPAEPTPKDNRHPALRSGEVHWNTPPDVLDIVREVGDIALDPCSNPWSMVSAALAWEEADDGLSRDWAEAASGGLIFVNPPFGAHAVPKWIAKVCQEAARGAEIVLLVPSRTDRDWFQDEKAGIWSAQAVCFWKDRLTFWKEGKPGPGLSTFPSLLAYWGPRGGRFAEVFARRGRVFCPGRAGVDALHLGRGAA